MMAKLMEDKRFLVMSLVALVTLGLSGYWLRSAYTFSDSVGKNNRAVEGRIAEMVGQEGGAEEDVHASEQRLTALVQSFQEMKTQLVFAKLDQYVSDDKLAIDNGIWGGVLQSLRQKANKQGVALPAETGFDNPNYGNPSDPALLKIQIADVLRKISVAEHVLELAIEAQVEGVSEVKYDPYVLPKPNEPTPLVAQVGVRVKVSGSMENFAKLLATLQQPGQFLMIELCSIRKSSDKELQEVGEFLVMELKVSALQIAEPVR